MSRFECLNNNNWQTKKTKDERYERNERKERKERNNYYNKNNYKKGKNVFTNIRKEEENFLDTKLFPALVKETENKEKTLKNYIGIVNHEIKTEKIKERIQAGWTLLYKKNNKIVIEKGKNLYNNYYKEFYEEKMRYVNATNILSYRYDERLELNEILGDISPYWDMDNQYEYDTREDEIIDTNDIIDTDYDYDQEYDN